ncbi:MAG: hypothetical protein Q7K40_02630 [bacterium]|nr:hypothetical protein [bacterium]
MTKFKKILIFIIVALVLVGAVCFFVFNKQKIKENWQETLSLTKSPQEEQELKNFNTLRSFAEKIDDCQNFGKQALLLNFKTINLNTTYENFGIGTWVGNGFVSTVEGEVGMFQDDDVLARKINEYEINFKTNDVVSMRQIDDPNRIPVDQMTADDAKVVNGQQRALYTFLEFSSDPKIIQETINKGVETRVRYCLSEILGVETFNKIDKSSDSLYKFTHLIGKENIENADNDLRYVGQNHVLRWENERYRPSKGLSSLMFPFIQVVITNSGHILSYESNLSFFENIQ